MGVVGKVQGKIGANQSYRLRRGTDAYYSRKYVSSHTDWTDMRKGFLATAVLGAAAIAVVGIGGGAVTGAQGGQSLDTKYTQLKGGAVGVDSGTVNQKLGVTALGNIDLVTTGTNTKTLVVGGNGCGNAWMAWDDSPAGAAYKVTRRSSWNAPGTCGGEVLNSPQLEMWGPNGDYSSHGTLGDGVTKFNEIDITGSGTTKTQWGNVDADWASVNLWYCAYLIPGGGGFWDDSACSV